MTGDGLVQIIAILAALVLVTSSFAAHRLSWSKGIRLGLVWGGLFVIVTLFVSLVTGIR